MANLTTKTASEFARINSLLDDGNVRVTYIWVIRTDGKVLRRIQGLRGSTYTVFGKVKADRMPATKADAVALLSRIATRRGQKVVG